MSSESVAVERAEPGARNEWLLALRELGAGLGFATGVAALLATVTSLLR